MRDFALQRSAARAAIELLGMRPVVAEDFPAKAHSSQVACLEGVRESDVVVLILGKRYGFVAKSGKSVTEEEVDHARSLGIPILSFLEHGERELEQDAFVQRLRSYESGYHMPSFTDLSELKDLVVKALNDHVGTGANRSLDQPSAKATLDEHQWGARRPSQHSVWFGAVIVPARRDQLVTIKQLSATSFQNNLLKEVVYGDLPIFGPEKVDRKEREESTLFLQEEPRGALATLEVYLSGALVYGKQLGQMPRNSYSLVRHYVIDRKEFQRATYGFLRFSVAFYNSLQVNSTPTSFYFGGSLSGIGDKAFGEIPEPEPSGLSMPGHGLGETLQWPREPRKLARVDLVNAERIAEETTEIVSRIFNAAGGYYSANNRGF